MSTKATTQDEVTRLDRVIGFMALWIARLALATLAVAGSIYFLGAVDPIIKYPVTAVLVAFLLKETM